MRLTTGSKVDILPEYVTESCLSKSGDEDVWLEVWSGPNLSFRAGLQLCAKRQECHGVGKTRVPSDPILESRTFDGDSPHHTLRTCVGKDTEDGSQSNSNMLTESFVAATLAANKPSQHLSAALRDVGIVLQEIQPQAILRHGYKRSSVSTQCLAVSRSHIFAAQTGKAVINVYSREKGNQESTVPFPERIRSIVYANGPEILILGTEEGKLILWEVGTGRICTSTAAHLQAVTHLCLTPDNQFILSGSADATVLVWSLANLISFNASAPSCSNELIANAPVATFSQHRDAITALGVGHSRASTNFVISASADSTCHIWHLQSCQVLRTVLLPSAPTSLVIDPADRAAYLGDAEGSITFIDILSLGKTGKTDATLPVQIPLQSQWTPSSGTGQMHAVALSHDATYLLSGHEDGTVLRWDVAKHKVASEVAKLGQPITNIVMLPPDGLPQNQGATFVIPEVIKPKLEFSTPLERGTSGIPANYKLHAALTGAAETGTLDEQNEDSTAMRSNGWPESMLDDAIRAIQTGNPQAAQGGRSNALRTEKLEAEVRELKESLAAHKAAELHRMERSLARMQKREDIDLKRRQAYHDAIKAGKDRKSAEAAMTATMDQSKPDLVMIDVESDAEAFGERPNGI